MLDIKSSEHPNRAFVSCRVKVPQIQSQRLDILCDFKAVDRDVSFNNTQSNNQSINRSIVRPAVNINQSINQSIIQNFIL